MRSHGGASLATKSDAARSAFIAATLEFNRLILGPGGDWRVAVRHANNALVRDSALVEPYLWLATFYANRLGITIRADEALALAHAHADRAGDSYGLLALGQVNVQLDLDYDAALRNLERARRVGVADSVVDGWIGQAYLAQGRLDEALVHLQTAYANGIGQDSLQNALGYAKALQLADRYAEAREVLERALRLTAGESFLRNLLLIDLVRVRHALGDTAAANAAIDEAWRSQGGSRPEFFPGLFALLGRTDEAAHLIAAADARFKASKLAFSGGALEGAFILGDFDAAFVWLDRVIDNREYVLFGPLRASSRFAALREDPRFAIAMKRLAAIEKPSP